MKTWDAAVSVTPTAPDLATRRKIRVGGSFMNASIASPRLREEVEP